MLGGTIPLLMAAWLLWRPGGPSDQQAPFEPPSRLAETSPLCPWRDPEADLRRIFPNATRHEKETCILSSLRTDLARHLGRQPNADENALTLYRVYENAAPLGKILVRRVKGQYCAMEVVVAVTEGRVQSVWLQRFREPPGIAAAVENREWLKRFQGRTGDAGWGDDDMGSLPEEARLSGKAIVEGIRSLLILLAAAETAGVPSNRQVHH